MQEAGRGGRFLRFEVLAGDVALDRSEDLDGRDGQVVVLRDHLFRDVAVGVADEDGDAGAVDVLQVTAVLFDRAVLDDEHGGHLAGDGKVVDLAAVDGVLLFELFIGQFDVVVQEQVAVAEEDAAFADPGREAEALFIGKTVDAREQVVLAEDDVLELVGQRTFGADDESRRVEDGVVDPHVVEGLDADDVTGVFREDLFTVDGKGVDVGALLDGAVAEDGGTLAGEALVIDVQGQVGRQERERRDGDGDDGSKDADTEDRAVADEAEDEGREESDAERCQGRQVRVLVGGVIGEGVFDEAGLVGDRRVVGDDRVLELHAAGDLGSVPLVRDDLGAVHVDAARQEPQIVECPAVGQVVRHVGHEHREGGRRGEQGDGDAGRLGCQQVDEVGDEVRKDDNGDRTRGVEPQAGDAEDALDDGLVTEGGSQSEDAHGDADGDAGAAGEGLKVVAVRGEDAGQDQSDDHEYGLDDGRDEREADFALERVFDALGVELGALVLVVQVVADVGVVFDEALIAEGKTKVLVDRVRVVVERLFLPLRDVRFVVFAAIQPEAFDLCGPAFPELFLGGVFIHLDRLDFRVLVVETEEFDLTVDPFVVFVLDRLVVAFRDDGLVEGVELGVRRDDRGDGLEVRGVRELPGLVDRRDGGDAFRDDLRLGGIGFRDRFLFAPDRADGGGGSGRDSGAGRGDRGGALRGSADFIVGRRHLFVFEFGELGRRLFDPGR